MNSISRNFGVKHPASPYGNATICDLPVECFRRPKRHRRRAVGPQGWIIIALATIVAIVICVVFEANCDPITRNHDAACALLAHPFTHCDN